MTPLDWDRLEALLERALALPPEERERFLARTCGEDEALRAEVESLMVHAESGADFLASGATSGELAGESTEAAEAPETLDRYRLVEKLGEGGMGEVWLAEQIEPVRRRVALKIIKVGMDTRRVLDRFDSERQALALMRHSSIVRLLDAGSTPAGRPYFVMDLIEGRPITAYADDRLLPVRERVRLVLEACRAIEYAHGQNIIHRDIKPSNLLVTVDGGSPSVRVIDFGIAKVITPSPEEARKLTRSDQLLGTPDYASAEQVGIVDAPIDHRTDVFSLGVVLYELLTGELPWADGGRAPETSRTRQANRPPPPSEQFTASDTQVTLAAARSTTPRELRRELARDLDHVTLRALARDPADRYATVGALADDLERYLDGRPVQARPKGLAHPLLHRARSWGRPAWLTAAAVAIVLVIQALPLSAWRDAPAGAADPAMEGPAAPGTPVGPITAPAALVVNMDEKHVAVIGLDSYRVLGAIPAGVDPQDIVVTPDGRTAFVTDRGADRILAIDLTSGRTTWMPSPGTSPQGIAITQDGRTLYVANSGGDDLRVIDLDGGTFELGARIPVGDEPFRARLSADGTRVFVPNRDSGDLSVISVETNTEVARIGGLRRPYDVAVAPDGSIAYISENAAGQLVIIDLVEETIVGRVEVGWAPEGVQVSPDGRRVFVANQGSSSISVIDAATRSVVGEIEVGDTPQTIVFTSDGTLGFVPNADSGEVSVVDMTRLEVVRSVDLAQGIVSMALVPAAGDVIGR